MRDALTDGRAASENRVATLPVATLSLDLDDLWAYLRTHGDEGWMSAPSGLPRATERLLPLLDDLGLLITVFVVGRDASSPAGRAAIRAFAGAGHEIANHSLEHRYDLARLPRSRLAEDIERSADAIYAITDQRPTGFRCPSFQTSSDLLAVLIEQGYSYDASVLPTSLTPLLRAYHRATMSRAARRRHAQAGMFGAAGNVRLPLSPFRWDCDEGQLLELPVTTFPLLRTPIHMSYLQAAASHSSRLSDAYFRLALRACRARSVSPSFLLHPPDSLDVVDAPELSYLPGMKQPFPAKLQQISTALAALQRDFTVLPLGGAALALEGRELPVRVLKQP